MAITPVVVMTARSIPVPQRPVMTPPPPRTPLAIALAAPEFEVADPSVKADVPCALTDTVAMALGHDSNALTALVAETVDPRRAVMLWDGGWQGRAESDPVRHAIIAVLHKASARCLDEAQVGPRLGIVALNGISIAIAVGSGTWTWRNLQTAGEPR